MLNTVLTLAYRSQTNVISAALGARPVRVRRYDGGTEHHAREDRVGGHRNGGSLVNIQGNGLVWSPIRIRGTVLAFLLLGVMVG